MNTYNILEFDKIKKILTEYCISGQAKYFLKNLHPYSDKSKILYNLNLIDELKILLQDFSFAFDNFSDIKELLFPTEEMIFSYHEFKKIYQNIIISENFIIQKRNLNERSLLKDLIRNLQDFPSIKKRYDKIFTLKGEIKDSASSTLQGIRRSQKSVRKNILKVLNHDMEHLEENNFLSDKIITQREGRYVIPIKRNSLPFVKGMITGSSSSGFSVYMEPAEVIPMNNRAKLLSDDEMQEIHKIFKEFTLEILQNSKILYENQRTLQKIDFYHGMARYASEYKANKPIISNNRIINLKNAKHPLLIKSLGDEKKVIPFDLKLGEDNQVMILSGPNTGGKTVTLKTVGLLTLMALSGLPITADEKSEIGLFANVFADIGDSQSIDNSLSTFSSHMNNISNMLNSGTKDSLILIDEIGSATDPEQGSALAHAILEKIISINAIAIITTHYTSLKLFAEDHEQCLNASMLFDPQKHIPTYHLIKGIPGNSFAIEVADSLGLDKVVIQRAKEILGKQTLDLNEIIKKISEERKQLSKEVYQYQLKNALYQNKISEYEKKLSDIRTQSKEIRQKALKKAQEYLINVRKEITNELKDIKKTDKKDKKQKLKKVYEKTVESFESALEEETGYNEFTLLKVDKPTVGMKVWVKNIGDSGEIISISDGNIKVDLNGMFFTTSADNIFYTKDSKEATTSYSKVKYAVNEQAKFEINLLGNTFDEALPKMQKFLDDAHLGGLKKVRIIHGKGTGILRYKIRHYLKTDKRLEDFFSATSQMGGDGVTIAVFSDD